MNDDDVTIEYAIDEHPVRSVLVWVPLWLLLTGLFVLVEIVSRVLQVATSCMGWWTHGKGS